MTRLLRFAFLLLALAVSAQAADPLRIFIRAGAKTHGPGQHDHPRFLEEWTKLLAGRGAQVDGGMTWPTPEQFAKTDVVIVFAPDPWDCKPEERAEIDKFAARGGGFVVLHDARLRAQGPGLGALAPRRRVALRQGEVVRGRHLPVLRQQHRPDHRRRVELRRA